LDKHFFIKKKCLDILILDEFLNLSTMLLMSESRAEKIKTRRIYHKLGFWTRDFYDFPQFNFTSYVV
ncbi:hypothetical protein L9F63_005044, partial [Diploptera punctata]